MTYFFITKNKTQYLYEEKTSFDIEKKIYSIISCSDLRSSVLMSNVNLC